MATQGASSTPSNASLLAEARKALKTAITERTAAAAAKVTAGAEVENAQRYYNNYTSNPTAFTAEEGTRRQTMLTRAQGKKAAADRRLQNASDAVQTAVEKVQALE
ncbi:hypothetical protein AURDEDRAFT_122140 [Auricularia subglabra TFB-10046 SS5]|nr:hypothetical protein AURDEDRAFT_122140 [Auricularia subglabra TFB-10046 SS5]